MDKIKIATYILAGALACKGVEAVHMLYKKAYPGRPHKDFMRNTKYEAPKL